VGACVSFFLVFHYGGTPNTSSFDRVGSSSVTFLDHRNGTPSLFDQIRKPKYGIFKRSHAARATIGGGMLGVGMVVAGACPGMVLPQIGTGVPNAGFTVLGGLAGALLHNECFEKLGLNLKLFGDSITKPDNHSAWQQQNRFLDVRFGWNYPVVMAVMAASLSLFALLLELLIPYENELVANNGWFPSLCGFGIGMLNLELAFNTKSTMGSSTSYSLLIGKKPKTEAQANESTTGLLHRTVGNYHQVLHLLAAVLGAYASAIIADNIPTSAPGVETPYVAFFGGMLMLFGSRLGNGCTSGHGIAGLPLLDAYGIIAVCSMFASGIIAAFAIGQDNLRI